MNKQNFFGIDLILLFSRLNCFLGIHSMNWENEDGIKHCYCYKKQEECLMSLECSCSDCQKENVKMD